MALAGIVGAGLAGFWRTGNSDDHIRDLEKRLGANQVLEWAIVSASEIEIIDGRDVIYWRGAMLDWSS